MPNPILRTLKHTFPLRRSILFLALLASGTASAQTSSLNTFSPYTMYGLGDMAVGGSAFNRPMGGIGVALRTPYQYNYQNPASMSAIPRQTAIFNFAGEGKNIYPKNASSSTTYNTFNLHDLGLAVPLGKGVGLGFSLTPVSSVGYTTRIIENMPSITENIGSTIYNYAGDGGITQVAMSLGVNVAKGFSLGASMNYWFGDIERQYNAMMTDYISGAIYRSVASTEKQNLSKILFTLGGQYTFRTGKNHTLTIGATYQPKVTARMKQENLTLSYSPSAMDTIYSANTRWNMNIPGKVAAGLCFQTGKFVAAFDYSRQNWKGAFEIPQGQNITLGTQQDYRLGFSYTPSQFDIRNALKRWTYKIGVRYSDSYLIKNGNQLHDAAVSLGVDFGLVRRGFSRVGIGIEYGQRGSRAAGQVRERYFNFVVALSLFGDNQYWFVRQKYN